MRNKILKKLEKKKKIVALVTHKFCLPVFVLARSLKLSSDEPVQCLNGGPHSHIKQFETNMPVKQRLVKKKKKKQYIFL